MLRSILVALTLIAAAAAQADPVFVTTEGAIRGYDPVAYHTEGRPVKGRVDITYRWQDAEWRFASAENRDRFAAAPDAYAPRYGGYCAFGTSRGYKVSTQPEAFSIVDGALYLNYNLAVQETWNEDRPGYIRKADENWIGLRDTPYEPEGE
jgi:hypothetical protein